MALNFPSNPTIGDIYTDTTSGFSYQWDGVVWQSYIASTSKNISILDDISGSFNGTLDTFALTVSGTSLNPANAQQLIIVLGGVIQEPVADYNVNFSNIIFTTPPTGGLSFSGVSLGPAVNLGVPGDNTVTPAKLSTGGPSWNTSGDVLVSGITIISNASGTVTIGVGTTALLVEGNARVTGILSVGQGTVTIDGTNNQIVVGTGVTICGNTGIISATTINATNFVGDGSGLTGAGSTVINDNTTNSTYYPLFTQTTSGTVTSSGVSTSKLSFNPSTGILTATSLGGSLVNTLTLNTSGTGLSGSTSFNNSGAATFTVTSNATSANTVSAIVARDASGNFSAGTITASLNGSVTLSSSNGFGTRTIQSGGTASGGSSGDIYYIY